MAISNLIDLRAAFNGAQRISVIKTPSWGTPSFRYYGMIWDYFTEAGYPSAGVSPSSLAGTLYSKSSAGAIPMSTVGGSQYALVDVQASAGWEPVNTSNFYYAGGSEFYVHVWDRIWANQIDSTSTFRQAWTFPGLTRYTTGQGLSIWLRILAQNTPPNPNITIEYTNQNGTPRTLTTFQFVSSLLYWAQPSILPLPLAAGDSGVRSVSAITLSAGFNVSNCVSICLMKYIGSYRVNAPCIPDSSAPLSLFNGLPSFDGNACLTIGIQPGSPPPIAVNAQLNSLTTLPRVGFEAKILEL